LIPCDTRSNPKQSVPSWAIMLLVVLASGYSIAIPAQTPASKDSSARPRVDSINQLSDTARIRAAIARRGLTEAEVRAQLQARGFDPRLADQYFGTTSSPNLPSDSSGLQAFEAALKAAGILVMPDTLSAAAVTVPEADVLSNIGPSSTGFGIFGKEVFSAQSTLFDPILAAPVDALYRLNAGDELQLIVTGDVERAYTLEIRRDGTIVVPQVGVIPVAGLTLDAARTLVKSRAATSFRSLNYGTAKLDLSVSRVRNNVVFVIGEAERPGSYSVGGTATVFNALMKAGGPSSRGSFRDVQVRRGEQVLHVDLYDYLLRGDASKDVRSANGDIIFIPLNTRAVALHGAVRRPAIFELKPDERFGDLIRFAGGLLPSASTERIQIDRILPPEQRQPGRERVLLDVRLGGNVASLDTVGLRDNDILTVFSIGSLRRNNLQLVGEVYQPGNYEWRRGMTLADLVGEAQGLMPWALSDRIKIERPIVATGRTEIFSVDFQDPSARQLPLHEFDLVTVLDGRLAFPGGEVYLSGSVNKPGVKPYVDRQTLADLIDLAGGLTEDAASIEVARRKVGSAYSDTASLVYRFPVGPNLILPDSASTFVIGRGDVVAVRKSPGYRGNDVVFVKGLFAYPGTYSIRTDHERLSEIIARAGGALPTAFPEAFRLIRDGHPVVLDYARIMKGDKTQNILPLKGDTISIGGNSGTVLVMGAVVRPAAFPYNRSWSLSNYIDAAGGLRPDANNDGISVQYASGGVATARRRFNLPLSEPEVRPGSTIDVAARDTSKDQGIGDTLTRIAQISTTFVSLVIGFLAVTK
jgi:polysaccharide export outer membrane protein